MIVQATEMLLVIISFQLFLDYLFSLCNKYWCLKEYIHSSIHIYTAPVWENEDVTSMFFKDPFILQLDMTKKKKLTRSQFYLYTSRTYSIHCLRYYFVLFVSMELNESTPLNIDSIKWTWHVCTCLLYCAFSLLQRICAPFSSTLDRDPMIGSSSAFSLAVTSELFNSSSLQNRNTLLELVGLTNMKYVWSRS